MAALVVACSSPPVANGDFYTVKSGDTLIALGQAFGQPYQDIARWNRISDEDAIQVGQVLRVKPPPVSVRSRAAAPEPAATTARKPAAAASATGRGASATQAPRPVAAEVARVSWVWPAQGRLSATTNRNLKGVDIAGTAGQPIWASAAGRVSYAGRGIRGYGNMIIVKHSPTLLSVYAHNKSNMVKEGQTVNRGQQIAEMGDTDSKKVKLYFEIRSNGKPIDPILLLPKQH